MAQNVTLIALTQMVDLSLNCHDGVINFQALHTLLHVMIQQLQMTDIAVEFRGPDSDRVQNLISAIKTPPIGLLPEYSIIGKEKGTNGKKKSPPKKQISLQDVVKQQKIEEKKEKEIRVIDRRKDSKEDPDLHPLPLKSPPGSFLGVTPGDLQTVVVIESGSQLPQYSVAVSKSIFDELQNDVVCIKNQIKELTDLPSNLGLIEASRSPSAPILDMFQIINLTKRMEANERVMEKVGSLIEDLAKGEGGEQLLDQIRDAKESGGEGRRSSVVQLEQRLTLVEQTIQEFAEGGDLNLARKSESDEAVAPERASATVDSGRHSVDRSSGAPSEVASVSRARKTVPKSKGSLKLWSPEIPYESLVQNVELADMSPNDALVLIQEEFNNLKRWVSESIKEVDKAQIFDGMDTGANSQVIESKFNECTKQIKDLNDMYNNQIGLLSEQFNAVQQEMNDIAEKLEVVIPGGDSTGINAETTMDLANKLALLENEMVAIAEKATKLQEEKKERDQQTEEILEQIDVLKIVKANREDLEDALGDKADACMINRKVSHDQFDAACDDLSRGIEEALSKLEEQEEMWHQALEAIQRDVGNKLDKVEVDPLREFVNSKLRTLQEKFKSLTALKREQEAAGTRSKLLRNVNCISCDKDVVMRKEMDVSLKPKAYAMPPNRNMAPYLAYELDQLRKQQKCVPGGKNLNFIENALKTRGARDKDHVCNRYCGGSHTVTTAQQRVTRLGHFLEQWGPEIAPLNEEYIRGVDKQMYKARDESSYRKMTKEEKQGQAKASQRVNKDTGSVPESELPQDRNTFVNPDAQADITDYEEAKEFDRGHHNIGSTGIGEETKASQAKPSKEAGASQLEEERRTSQPEQGSSQTGVPRASQGGEPRASQTGSRQSQSAEARTSQTGSTGRRSSLTQADQRPSQTPSAARKTSASVEAKISPTQQG